MAWLEIDHITFVLIMIVIIIFTSFLFGFTLYLIILFDDLRRKELNAHDIVSQLDWFVLPEYIGQAIVAFVLLLISPAHMVGFIFFLWNLPVLAFHANRFYRNKHKYDATRVILIMDGETKVLAAKAVFYVVSLAAYMVAAIIWGQGY